jgi:hypothetical protein
MADPPFDPDEFIRQAPPFDPDAFLRATTPPAEPPSLWQGAKDMALVGSAEGTAHLYPRALAAIDAATSDKTYSQAVDERFALEQAAKQRLGPFMSSTADAVGGVLTGAGLARSGATLLGRTAPWTWSRFGANVIEPGIYGAIHAAGGTHSGDYPDYVKNALVGLGVGSTLGGALPAVVPAVGAAASAIYKSAADKFAGIPSALGRAARADAPGLSTLATHGPESMLLNAGPSMESVAQAYVQGTGDYRTKIVNALAARDRGTTARLQADREAALGPAPRVSQIEAGLDTERKAINTHYKPLMQGRAIDAQGADKVLADINDISRSRRIDLDEVSKSLTLPGTKNLPDLGPEAWLTARHRIDSMIAQARAGADKYRANNLADVRDLIDAQLAKDVPGIKAIDARFQHIARQGEALQQGRNIYDTGKEAVHPADVADIVATGTPETVLRLRQGAHADLERRLGTTERDLSKLEGTIKTPWNQEKSIAVLGAQPTADITQSAATNRMFRENYDRIARGSDTAQRIAARQENELTPLPKIAGSAWERLVEKPAGWLIDKMRTAANERQRSQIAEILVAQGAERDAQAARLLQHNARVLPRAEAVDKYTRAVTQGGLGALLNPFTDAVLGGNR